MGATVLIRCSRVSVAVIVSASIHSSAFAAEGLLPELVAFSEIPQVYSALRSPQPILESPAAILVLTEKQLKQTGATHLPDALRMVSGLDVWTETGFNADVGARGLTTQFSTSMRIMLDGRPLYTAHIGGINWQQEHIMLDDVERVEIVRSPGSAVYGTDAFAGVINIVTKSPWKQSNVDAATSVGNRGQNISTVSAAAAQKKMGVHARFWHEEFDGYGHIQTPAFNDAYHLNRAMGRWDLRPDPGTHVMYQWGYNWRVEGYPGATGPSAANNDNKMRRLFHHLLYDHQFDSGVAITARVFRNELEINWIDFAPDPFGHTEESRSEGEAQAEFPLPWGHRVTLGSDAWRDRDTSRFFSQQSFTETGYAVYLQDQWKIGSRWIFSPGSRFDHHSAYRWQVSPRVSLVYLVSPSASVRFAFNRAFQNPTFIMLHSDVLEAGPLHVLGDPSLGPQQITSYEAGYQHQLVPGTWLRTDLFYSVVTDRIGPVPDTTTNPPTLRIQRLSEKQFNRGFEVGLDSQWASWFSSQVNYSYIDTYLSDAHAPVDNISRHKGNLGFTAGPVSGWSTHGELHLVGPRSATGFGDLPGYAVLNARIAKSFQGDLVEFSFSVQNLLNNEHREFPNFGFVDRLYLGKFRVRL